MTQTGKLTASDGAAGDDLGVSVSIAGATLVAGAYDATVGGNADQGAAYVFMAPSSGWASSQTQAGKFVASDGAADDYFGWSASISGNSLVVSGSDATVNGNADQGAAYVFQLPAASVPTVNSVSPRQGPQAGGTTVTITGTNLSGATAVMFGNVAGTIKTRSATKITAVSPAGTPGAVAVTVISSGLSSSTSTADQFTYLAAPSVAGISPAAGPTAGGTKVTITGANLANATAVRFGTKTVTKFISDSPTQIVVACPAGAAGMVNVSVVTAGGASVLSAADQYTYVAAPAITKISPASGPTGGGTQVTITGTNLANATAVMFGTVAVTTFTVDNGTQIVVTTPPGVAGTVNVRVVTAGGTSALTSKAKFKYVASPMAAVLSLPF